MTRTGLAVALMAALLGSTISNSTRADLLIGLGFQGGTAKQEMSGGTGPHFSLVGADNGLRIELRQAPDPDRPGLGFGLRYTHDAPQPLSSADSPRPWHRSLGRQTRTRSDSLTLTIDMPLWRSAQGGETTLDFGFGVADTRVSLATQDAAGNARAVLPRAELGLRHLRPLGDSGAFVWSGLSYAASPALEVSMSDGGRLRHETSALTAGFGILIPFSP